MKTELEEGAEQYLESKDWRNLGSFNQLQNIFTEGAKWQQERSYSEEEVYHILIEHTAFLFKGGKSTLTEWFEQFKKNDEIIDDSIFDIKIEQPTNQSDKIKYFNYFLYKLYQHKGSKNDFGKNKINPLFFFLLNAVDGYILYDIFDDFYALPYGPIENTINHLIKNQEELSFTITRFELDKKSDFIPFQDENTKLIDKAFDRLVTTTLIEKSVTYMVDLSMEHESLLNARRNAVKENKLAYPISNDDLKNELKFFYE